MGLWEPLPIYWVEEKEELNLQSKTCSVNRSFESDPVRFRVLLGALWFTPGRLEFLHNPGLLNRP